METLTATGGINPLYPKQKHSCFDSTIPVSKGPNDNESAMALVKAYRRTGGPYQC